MLYSRYEGIATDYQSDNQRKELQFKEIQADFQDIASTMNTEEAQYLETQLESYRAFEKKLR